MNLTEITNDTLTRTANLNRIQAHVDLTDTHDLLGYSQLMENSQ